MRKIYISLSLSYRLRFISSKPCWEWHVASQRVSVYIREGNAWIFRVVNYIMMKLIWVEELTSLNYVPPWPHWITKPTYIYNNNNTLESKLPHTYTYILIAPLHVALKRHFEMQTKWKLDYLHNNYYTSIEIFYVLLL